MIVKYKLVNGRIPSNIVDGGYFVQGDYLIGKAIPMEQEIITKEELLALVLAKHEIQPMKNIQEDRDLTKEEVTAIVNNWCTQRGE